MKKPISNHGKSVKTRLLNLMNEKGYKYMYLLSRYFNERLLYRVSVSQYKDNFLLKGGSLLYAVDGLETRPTIDIDFMASRISMDREYLETVFREILDIPCDADGVTFDLSSLRSEPITVEKKYPGTRFFVTARMDTIIYPMSMDIGFGDVVTPCPMSLDYPLLLTNIPSIQIQAYSLETVIAEKFHTMIDRDVSNSRMKDFYDCHQLLTRHHINNQTLYDAICTTFDNRQLEYNSCLQLFTSEFSADAKRNVRWNSFIKKINVVDAVTFQEAMRVIIDRLYPLYNQYWSQKQVSATGQQLKEIVPQADGDVMIDYSQAHQAKASF